MPLHIFFTFGLVNRSTAWLCKHFGVASVPVFLVAATLANAQSPDSITWTRLSGVPAEMDGATPWVKPDLGELFELDTNLFRAKVAKAAIAEPAEALGSGTEVTLPMPDGSTARFMIVEAPIMEPELAANFPELRTYAGRGIDDEAATVRLDVSPKGLHAQVLSPNGAVYVDPAFRGNSGLHVSYYKRDYPAARDGFHCLADDPAPAMDALAKNANPQRVLLGSTLRTFRLAVAATGEYTAFFGGKVSDGMAAIVTAVNRVDGVYETELAIRLVLVAKNNLIVYTNAATDPYSNDSSSTLLTQNQSNLDSVIGGANYDVGHVFSTGGGGLAGLGVVCSTTRKARGETGRSSPVGDPYYIDYVCHEIGHQFGANHTFNATTGSCSDNRESTAAYEPGSGSTIMAYAGLCDENDLQSHSDPYFHAFSQYEIQTCVAATSCAVNSSTGNSAPAVSAGPAYAIPAGTPFVLTATATDPQADPLTYCWEEMDLGPEDTLASPDNGSSPLFRSLPPTAVPQRYFPRLSSMLGATNWNEEKLPTTSRTLHFRVTARDNRSGGGGVASADTQITVVSSAGPFAVTQPNAAASLSGDLNVRWNVAGTDQSPISAATVNIRLSADGGNTFPYLLASNAPNTGSCAVTLPNISTTAARIKVEAAAGIFFDISDTNFTVVPSGPLLQPAGAVLVAEAFTPTNGVIDPYETVTVSWGIKNIGRGGTSNLVAALLATNGVFYPGAPQAYGRLVADQTAWRSFDFIPSGACGGAVTAVLQLRDGSADLGTVTQSFTLGKINSTITTQAFASTVPISIVDAAAASPYPSTIVVSGVTNPVINLVATLKDFSHSYPSDVGVLLVAPSGQRIKLIDDCGGSNSVTGLNLSFSDTASSPVDSPLTSGIFLPSANYDDTFMSPAPAEPYESTLKALAASPNGTWSLFVQDFIEPDGGSINGGWSLQLVSSNAVSVCSTNFPTPTFASTTYSGNNIEYAWTAIPGPHYQVQYRTNLSSGTWRDLGSAMLGTNVLMKVTDPSTNSSMRFFRVIAQP